MFRIKKLYFIVGGIVAALVLVPVILSVMSLSQKSLCEKQIPSCGVTLSTRGDVSVITGRLVNKYQRGDNFYFQMVTLDKNQNPYTLTFTNPPNFPKMTIDKVPLATGENSRTDMLGKTLSMSNFYNFITPQIPLRVFVYNPKYLTAAQLAKAPEVTRKCIPYKISVLEYLENPSIKASMISRYLSMKGGCQMTLADVGI